jgi:uncharacterized protein YndB with AHSA1/START domain
MITQLFGKPKGFTLERSYAAPVGAVWAAWTRPEMLREWWGPEHTSVTECEVDLRVGGPLRVVMEAGPGMGKYQGTRWPMEGTFTHVEEPHRLAYDARSWTEGEETTTTIEHANDVTLVEDGGTTSVTLQVRIVRTGSGAKMKLAAFGMKWGYKAHLDHLGTVLAAEAHGGT